MYRLSYISKWDNDWYKRLTPQSKVLFMYLVDNCDIAGFFNVDIKNISYKTNLSEEEVKISFVEIRKSYVVGNPKSKIWLRNFLHYQKLLPLNITTDIGQEIYSLINKNLPYFTITRNLLQVIISKAEQLTDNKKIVYPKYSDFKAYFLSIKPNSQENEMENMFGYYQGLGWTTVSGLKIINWKYYIKSRILSNMEVRNNSSEKINNHIDSVNKVSGIDFNDFKK